MRVVGDNQRNGKQSAVNPDTLDDDVQPVHRSGYLLVLKRSQSLKRDRPSEDNPDSAKTYGFRVIKRHLSPCGARGRAPSQICYEFVAKSLAEMLAAKG